MQLGTSHRNASAVKIVKHATAAIASELGSTLCHGFWDDAQRVVGPGKETWQHGLRGIQEYMVLGCVDNPPMVGSGWAT